MVGGNGGGADNLEQGSISSSSATQSLDLRSVIFSTTTTTTTTHIRIIVVDVRWDEYSRQCETAFSGRRVDY